MNNEQKQISENERQIEYLQKLIDEKQLEADCTDRKSSQEAYDYYSGLCTEVRVLEQILVIIKNQNDE